MVLIESKPLWAVVVRKTRQLDPSFVFATRKEARQVSASLNDGLKDRRMFSVARYVWRREGGSDLFLGASE